ncbi:hypothetical protein LCGC14_1793530 [marine sediment metagenome]|uniref:Uncharacterized protein n=1 Tax=marine sediment metagenome TaxID=412755 RepID=A0A0F9GRV3_9ZZZZ
MDILERLRESVHWMVINTSNVPTKHIQVMDDAYDEIERLRKDFKGSADLYIKTIKRMEDRKPLTSYKDMYGSG